MRNPPPKTAVNRLRQSYGAATFCRNCRKSAVENYGTVKPFVRRELRAKNSLCRNAVGQPYKQLLHIQTKGIASPLRTNSCFSTAITALRQEARHD